MAPLHPNLPDDCADAEPEAQIDEELKKLLLARIDGPWVDVHRENFAPIRAKFQAYLDETEEQQP